MRTLAIMQPYFFPYLGYFSLIKNCDEFILLEDVQFIKHGWIERNRILKPDGLDWQYIMVPLQKYHQQTLIKDILINNTTNWKQKIFSQLEHYKKKSRQYSVIIDLIHECLAIETESITQLNKHILERICSYLHIHTPITVFSLDSTPISLPASGDEWALNICKARNVYRYINPVGGIDFFDVDKYMKNGIKINFIVNNLAEYSQGKNPFISGLSIIDVLMYNSIEQVNALIDNITIK